MGMIFGLTDTLLIVAPTFFVLYLLRKCFSSYRTNTSNKLGNLWNVKEVHGWTQNSLLSQPSYCNVCENLIVSGCYICECCGAASESRCLQIAETKLECKCRADDRPDILHHWLQGNLEAPAFCEVCNEECGTETGLVDFQCIWCLRCVHTDCLPSISVKCDLGILRKVVVPPSCVTTKGIRRKCVVRVAKPAWKNEWIPILVFANSESGSAEAAAVLSRARRLLNPLQCFDITHIPPGKVIDQWCKLLHPIVPRILVAGGDGSVSWILGEIEGLNLQNPPSVAVLPLGTGNDLSRILNWGSAHSNEEIRDILLKVYEAKEDLIDRWQAVMTPFRHLGLRMPSKSLRFTNYFSIGVDALITLNFHKARQSSIYPFKSRVLNKFLYLTFGTKDVLEHSCEGLDRKIVLYLDGQQIPLPELEAVVMLNIDCWGGGAKPWKLGDFGETSYNDGLIEVFGVSSSFHIAQMQVGISAPIRLGQAKSVKIILRSKVPAQADGEPWEQHPAEIAITHACKSKILCQA